LHERRTRRSRDRGQATISSCHRELRCGQLNLSYHRYLVSTGLALSRTAAHSSLSHRRVCRPLLRDIASGPNAEAPPCKPTFVLFLPPTCASLTQSECHSCCSEAGKNCVCGLRRSTSGRRLQATNDNAMRGDRVAGEMGGVPARCHLHARDQGTTPPAEAFGF
jgi:hypothetical protein